MTFGPHASSHPAVHADTTWRARAGCRSAQNSLFFPAGDTGAAIGEILAAKAICHACPVPRECLQFALETKQEYGIWGGTTEDERRRLRRAWLLDRRRRAG